MLRAAINMGAGCTSARTHAPTHQPTHTHARTHAHARTHTCTHMHTRTQAGEEAYADRAHDEGCPWAASRGERGGAVQLRCKGIHISLALPGWGGAATSG